MPQCFSDLCLPAPVQCTLYIFPLSPFEVSSSALFEALFTGLHLNKKKKLVVYHFNIALINLAIISHIKKIRQKKPLKYGL